MKKTLLKLTVLTTLGVSAQTYAAGFEPLPATGFASSAYTNCYNDGRVIPSGGIANNVKGNFGSYQISVAHYPTASTNNTCWIAKPATEGTIPAGKTGFSASGSTIRTIPNPIGGAVIGEVLDKYWRNPTTSMCIIATRVRMFNVPIYTLASPGSPLNYFEVNDIVRGGFSGSGTVNVAYTIFVPGTNGIPVYRVGRTFTSVQHRALKYDTLADKQQNGINYLDLPTKNSVAAAITGETIGVGSTTAASTTLATQDAAVNANYVDFTAEASFFSDNNLDLPPGSNAFSPLTYIEAACTANPTEQAGAIRLRQTGQEVRPMQEIIMPGYAIGTP